MKAKFLLLIFGILLPAQAAFAQSCPYGGGQDPNELCNPSGAASIDAFFHQNFFAPIVGILGIAIIIMVVYSGLRMILAQGQSEAITKAKSSLKWSLGGAIIVICGFVIIAAVSNFFGAREPVNPADISGASNPIQSATLNQLAVTIFNSIAGVAGILALFSIIINGFRYLTAQGNDEQTALAKSGLQWSIFGLVIVLAAYVIVAAALKLFGSNL